MKKILSTLVLCSLIAAPMVHAQQQGEEIENAIADWIFFDNTGEVVNASKTQIRNFVRDGKKSTFYNALGEPLIERAGNRVTTNLTFGADGKTVESYVSFGIKQGAEGDFVDSAYEYERGPDGEFRIKKQVWANGYRDYEYDEYGNITSRSDVYTDGNGNITSTYDYDYEYDADGNQLFYSYVQKNANGDITSQAETQQTYDENGNRTSYYYTNTNSLGQVGYTNVDYEYNEDGQMSGSVTVQKANQFSHYRQYTREYEYDESGKTTFVQNYVEDKNANGTTGGWWYDNNAYTYDEEGRQLTSRREIVINGNIVKEHWDYTRTYDEQGNQSSYTSFYTAPNGTVTGSAHEYNREYDEEGRQTTYEQVTKDVNGNVTRSTEYEYEYDEQGNQSYYSYQNKDANGNVTQNNTYSYDRTYDEAGKTTNIVQTRLDADGNVLSVYNTIPKYNEAGEEVGGERTSLDADGNVTGSYEYTYDYSDGNYEQEYISKDANGNVTYLEKYDNYSWGYAEFDEDGEVAYFYGDGELKYTKNNEDGSKKEVSLKSIYTDKDGTGATAIDASNYESVVNTYETKEYNTAGNYTGYEKSDIDYDLSGNLETVTVLTYSGDSGSEAYSGKKEYSGYTYDQYEYTTGYSLTEYDVDDNVTSTKVVSNITYDYTGKKIQWDYQILNAEGNITKSGTEYAN